jgi:hypothetical protein
MAQPAQLEALRQWLRLLVPPSLIFHLHLLRVPRTST